MTVSLSTYKQRLRLFILLSFGLSATATVLRLLSLLFFYDSDMAYYTVGAPLPIISNIFYAISAIFFIVAAFFLIKPENDEIPAPNQAVKYAALIPCAALAVHALFILLDIVKIISEFGAIALRYILKGEVIGGVNRLDILLLVFAIFSAIFFANIAFAKQHSLLTVISGTGVALWIGMSWVGSYMDFFVPMNSPDKLLFHFACIGAALLLVGELRAIYGIPNAKTYYFSLSCAILTLSVSAIPSIIGDFANSFRIYSTEYENIVFFALLIYAAVRGFSLMPKKEPSEQTTTEETQE